MLEGHGEVASRLLLVGVALGRGGEVGQDQEFARLRAKESADGPMAHLPF